MRILILSDFTAPKLGGIERHISDLGAVLAEHGHEVHIATGVKPTPPDPVPGVSWHFLPIFPLASGVTLPCYSIELFWLTRLHNAYAFDVVHCHQSYSTLALTGLLWARAVCVPAVFTDHSMGWGDLYYEMLLSPLRQCALALSAHSIFVSRECRDNMIQLRHVSLQGNSYVIPNMVPSRPVSCGIDSGMRHKLRNLPAKRLQIVFVQRLVTRKGTALIVPLMEHLATRGVSADVFIVGEGLLEDTLKKSATDSEQLRFLFFGGKQNSEVRSILAASHILVIPSYLESFSIVLVEALQEGCIPVATNMGGMVSVYTSISPALASRCLCEPSVDRLCQCILDLRKVPLEELLSELSGASETARNLYAPPLVVEQIVAVYGNACKELQIGFKGWMTGLLRIWHAEADYFLVKLWFLTIFVGVSIGCFIHKRVHKVLRRGAHADLQTRSVLLPDVVQIGNIHPKAGTS